MLKEICDENILNSLDLLGELGSSKWKQKARRMTQIQVTWPSDRY
jgi:hypothetical protein